MRGFLVGALGLVLLEVLVTHPGGQLVGLAGSAGGFARRLLSPNVPAFGPIPAAPGPGLFEPPPSGGGQEGQTPGGSYIAPPGTSPGIPGQEVTPVVAPSTPIV